MYARILVPTDGSEHARAAAARAFDLADQFGAAVHLLAVVDTGPFGSVRLPGDAARAIDVLSDEAESAIDQLTDRASTRGIDTVTEVREGTPVDQILAYAEEVDASLVVMGSRGRGGIDRMVLGSVTDGVIRYGEVDVLVASRESD